MEAAFMKKSIAIGLCLILFSGAAYAETRYVKAGEITLRTGPGNKHKIIAMVPSGQKLDMLEPGSDWSRVRLLNGKEGWSLTQYLTTQIPDAIKLTRLGKKHAQLTREANTLQQVSSDLKEENQRLRAELADTQKKLSDTSNAYESLKNKSADFFKLDSNYKEATTRLSEQTEKAVLLEDRLKQNNIYLFLSGAGVLLAGFIIGLLFRRQRRRSSLLS